MNPFSCKSFEKQSRSGNLAFSLFALLLFAGLAGCGGGGSGSDDAATPLEIDADGTGTGSGSPDSSEPSTVFESLMQQRAETGVTKEYALAQFVAYFGPLQSAPEYEYDGSMPLFATIAIDELILFADQLDSAVLAEVVERILPVPSEGSVIQQRRIDETFQTEAREIAVEIGNLMGRTLQSTVEVFRVATVDELELPVDREPLLFVVTPFAKNYILTETDVNPAEFGLQELNSCWVGINEAPGQTFDGLTLRKKTGALAHEVVHCFQHEMMSERIPQWIIEGTASWAGEAYVGGTDHYEDMWRLYERPTYPLLSAYPYSALGFWSHVSNELNGDLWSMLPAIFESTGSESVAALSTVVDQIGFDAYATWPLGRVLQPQWGPEWESVGVSGRTTPAGIEAVIDNLSAAAFGEVRLLAMDPSVVAQGADIITVETNGMGAMHWSNSGDTLPLDQPSIRHFCVSGDCLCDNGEVPTGFETITAAPANEFLVIAMTGTVERAASTFQYSTSESSQVCSQAQGPVDGGGSSGSLDTCLIGEWFLDLDFMEQQIRESALANGGGSGFVNFTGGASFNLVGNGTGTSTMNLDMSELDASGNTLLVVRYRGERDFSWGASNGDYITTYDNSGPGLETTLEIQGNIIPIDSDSTTVSSESLIGPSADRGSTYTCSPESLLISVEGDNAYDFRYTRNRNPSIR